MTDTQKIVLWVLIVLAVIAAAMVIFGLGSDKASAQTTEQPGVDVTTEIQAIPGAGPQPRGGGCKTVWGRVTYENFLGFDLLNTDLYVYFCWNGNRVTTHNADLKCRPTKGGNLNGWDVRAQSKNGHYKRFNGNDQGAWEQHGYCRYVQSVLGYQTNQHEHFPELNVFSNGGARWDGHV